MMAEDLNYIGRVNSARLIANQVIRIPFHNWFFPRVTRATRQANTPGWLVTRIGVVRFKCTCPDYQGRQILNNDEDLVTRIWDSSPHFYPCKHIIAVCMIERINYMRIILGEISTDMVYNFNVISGKDPTDTPVEVQVTPEGYLIVSSVGGGGGGDASSANQVIQIARLDTIISNIASLGTEATLANIETALGDKATEATLEAVRILVSDVDSTLNTLGTEATLEAARVLLSQINTTTGNIESAIASLDPLTDTQLRASPVPVSASTELKNAIMINIPPLDLGDAGTVKVISFTDILSLEFRPRVDTEIWYTFASDGFTTGAYEILDGVGQSYEYGQAETKFTGTLYLQDPTNNNTLVGFTGFYIEGGAVILPPAITSFTPTVAGNGDNVTVTGSGFVGTTSVSFGGTDAQSFTVDDDSQITATVDNGSTGDIVVTNPSGTESEPGFIYFDGLYFNFVNQDLLELTANYQEFNFVNQDLTELEADYQEFNFVNQDLGVL